VTTHDGTTHYGTTHDGTAHDGTGASDPDQIRREIERTQSHLSSDVDALTEKVTPGRIVDRRMERARGAAARWKDKVMGSNPMHSSSHTVTGSHGGGGHDGPSRASAHRLAESMSGTASSAASSMSDTASSAAGAMQEAPHAARQQAQGNPLAAGLIAFGAGWLISSILPASRREQELAEQARDRAGELGQPVAQAAKQVATEVRDHMAEPAQQAVESVRSTATDAGQTVADEGRSAAGQVQGTARDAAGNVTQSASSSRHG
jgi:hypothetical protein